MASVNPLGAGVAPQSRPMSGSAPQLRPGAAYRGARSPRAGQGLSSERLASPLGWFSIGLGLAELALPRSVGRLAGIGPRPTLLRLYGLRELGAGVGLLQSQDPTPWLWSRVAGDVLDLATLATGFGPRNAGRGRALTAFALVAGITALDFVAASGTARRSTRGRIEGAGGELYLERSVLVGRPPEECYRFWREVENLPRFMPGLVSVKRLDERRSHWVLRGPGGARIEWDAELTDDRPGERLAWRTLDGATVRHAGTVHFDAAPGGRGTFVRVSMHYSPVGGRRSAQLARLLGQAPESRIREQLRHFRQVLETGEIPTTRGQSHGRRSFFGARLQHWSRT